ncbi:RecB family exonuclease [Loktanella sp. R86503]|uniref:PD-(D/E)XK nuclease family protein n=1 Tax=Loktanella sp. R86503 TaxID=3093847 RepID=UPI0036DD8D74
MFYAFDVADPHSGTHYRLTDARLADLSLAPKPEPYAPGKFIAAKPSTVWAESFANAPVETIAAVSGALQDVILGTYDLRPPVTEALPDGRAKRHLMALVGLWREMGDALPDGLATARHVLDLPHGQFLAALPIVDGSLDPLAPPAIKALHDRLKAEFGSVPIKPGPARQPGRLIDAIQTGLTRPVIAQMPHDATLAVWGLRDPAACADFAAARARAMIEEGVPARKIAVLTAGDPQDLARAFAEQGVPLSGLPAALPTRDIAGETLLHLLLAKRPPTPAMVLAGLCLSPLMPWGAQTGRDLAEDVMSGHFSGGILTTDPEHHALWTDLRQPATSLPQLRLLLDLICGRMTKSDVLRQRIQSLQAVLAGNGPPDWDLILRAVQVDGCTVGDPARTLEGVSLWSAHESPWRPCHHLLIVDFNEGLYPVRPRANALFLDSEIAQIAVTMGLQLRGRTEGLARSIALFEAQLGAVTKSVTCLVPYRDLAGGRLAPSAGLSLIGRAVAGLKEASDLIVDLSHVPPTDWPVAVHPVQPCPAPWPVPTDLWFDKNRLLELRRDDDGAALPQSPSRLENLLVSPLAWLLEEIGAGDMGWQAESLDIMLKGNIAHHVFEHSFLPNVDIPDEATLNAALPEAYDAALRRNAPFMRAGVWEMERATLLREITAAAHRWRNDLIALNARILGNETWLYGDAHGIRIRGKADTILGLPDGTVVIVDHKKSGTAGRRKRMEKGWDLQVGLYGAMLERPFRRDGDGLDAVIGRSLGIAYHLMNDGGVLTSGVALTAAAKGRDMGDCVNVNAVTRLTERLAQVAGGQIVLNTTCDHSFFTKEAGFTPYALQNSPLIAAFMREDDQ